MNQDMPPIESDSANINGERARSGLITSFVGLVILTIGAKPEVILLGRSPTVGFVQISIILVGLAIICLGGYIGLAALWGKQEKTIIADIGIRLISTGYVIALFSGMADVFGMTVQETAKTPFFGPWQQAGIQIGMLIIAIGILMIIPYHHLRSER